MTFKQEYLFISIWIFLTQEILLYWQNRDHNSKTLYICGRKTEEDLGWKNKMKNDIGHQTTISFSKEAIHLMTQGFKDFFLWTLCSICGLTTWSSSWSYICTVFKWFLMLLYVFKIFWLSRSSKHINNKFLWTTHFFKTLLSAVER